MNTDGWDDFHRRWTGLKPPLRPNAEVAAAVAALIAGREERVLLLGVTPELSGIGGELVAVDWSEPAIVRIWPGDDGRRRALCADWREMPLPDASLDAAIGDGSLNVLASSSYPALFGELTRVLRPKARVAVRCYLTPENCESVAALRDAVMEGGIGFHAFKWRLAMAFLSEAGDCDVAVIRIHEAFERLFPDRRELSRATGWSFSEIAEIDAYRRSPACLSFPTPARMLASLPPELARADLVPAGTYELAERCPLLIAERR